MTLQEIRVSGLLEQYVIGAIDQDQKEIVENAIIEFPQLLSDIKEIGTALEQYLTIYQESPTPLLKERIISSIDSAPAVTPTSRRLVTSKTKAPSKSKSKKNNPSDFDLIKAIGLSLAGLFLMSSLWLWISSNGAEEKHQIVINQLKTDIEKEKEINNGLQLQIDQLGELYKQNNKIYHMTPARRYPLSRLYLIDVPDSQKKFLHIGNLPPLPVNGRYQLWTVGANGQVATSAVISESNDFISEVEIAQSTSLILSIETNPDLVRPTRRNIVGSFSFN